MGYTAVIVPASPYLYSNTRSRGRRILGARKTTELFRAFNKWGWDTRGWAQKTRSDYYYTAVRAEGWLRTHHSTSLVWASYKELEEFLFSTPPIARTRNHYRAGLVAVFEFFVWSGIRPDNIAKSLPRIKEPRSLPRPLPTELALRVLGAARACTPDHQALICLFLYGGLRRTEARLLEWRHIEPGWLRFTGKGSKERAIPIHPELKEALAKWKVDCPSPRWLFPSPLNIEKPMSSNLIGDMVHAVGDMIGYHLTPHEMRHTVATRMLEQGADIREVQEFLGHASLNTTQVYTKVRPARLADAVRALTYKEEG